MRLEGEVVTLVVEEGKGWLGGGGEEIQVTQEGGQVGGEEGGSVGRGQMGNRCERWGE